jgi:hypothetical protein
VLKKEKQRGCEQHGAELTLDTIVGLSSLLTG